MKTTTTYKIDVPKLIFKTEEGEVFLQMQILNTMKELKKRYNYKNLKHIDYLIPSDNSIDNDADSIQIIANFEVEL